MFSGLPAGQRLQIEQNVDLDSIHEREKAIKQLEVESRSRTLSPLWSCQRRILHSFLSTLSRLVQSDIVDVNVIFKDLALMVHEQGDVVGPSPPLSSLSLSLCAV